ncbi:hypothetical protein CALVIDRAFT_562253 [Calocera viscosa TUFC12733]|uniref:Mitochondrial carrier n=1 Tax=Calocera viscosa (strain TUFC12733) TaxID=1330018 RepID=A0A167P224_CALVF|nr:hypothetical protein CALVIDRAFT_562253 [Calocera viscosa TUFC12733]
MDFGMFVLTVLALIGTILLSLLITVPFLSLVIRYRAHYSPRALGLPDSDSPTAPLTPSSTFHTGPEIKGILHLLSRIRAQEGWAGLYKGICPVLAESLLGGFVSLLYFGISSPGMGVGAGSSYAVAPRFGLAAFGWAVFSLLLNLPMTVILNRSITTPYRLPYSPLRALRLLLSPSEFRAPWKIYALPGLLPTKLLHIAYLVLLLPALRALLVPSFRPASTYPPGEDWGDDVAGAAGMGFWGGMGLGTYIVFLLLSTAVLCPLEIIALRLSLQPLSGPTVAGSAPVHPAAPGLGTNLPASQEPPLFGTEEDVIHLRTPESGGEPYEGLRDCWRKIVQEEGWRVLARAWWLTLIATAAAGFS